MTELDDLVIRSADRVVPHPPCRVPILGDVLDLHVTESSQWGWRDAVKYGPIYERKILGTRVTFVSGPELVGEVNDESRWAKFLGLPIKDMRSVAGDGLFTAHNSEPNWAAAHAILAPAFTKDSMRHYHDTMIASTRELTRYWRNRPAGAWVDVASDMNKLALQIIGRAAFGYEFDSFTRTEPHPLVEAMLRILKYINRSAYSHPVLEATVFRSERGQHRRDLKTATRVVDDIVAHRAAHGPSGAGRDLLDLMLSTPDPATGRKLSAENVRNQILTFFTAGQETSAGVLAFAVHYLSQHPEVVTKARREIEAIQAGDELAFEEVGKLRYVRRIVDETLRLWPVAPGYYRKAKQDTVIGGRYPFEAGEYVFVALLALHRDRAWGADAERFDPDRWERDRVPRNLAELYKPFGTGMRACIGRQFAYHEIVVALAMIVMEFDLDSDPDYELRVNETISLKPAGLRARVRYAS